MMKKNKLILSIKQEIRKREGKNTSKYKVKFKTRNVNEKIKTIQIKEKKPTKHNTKAKL